MRCVNSWGSAIFPEPYEELRPDFRPSHSAYSHGQRVECRASTDRRSEGLQGNADHPSLGTSDGLLQEEPPYALITDASLGDRDQKKPRGLGAILTQINEKGEHQVIAYTSQKLVQHEKNYMPYLLEMHAAIWAMEHFDTHLQGRHFTLLTDHQMLEKLGKVHTKTLNRLQEAMLTFNFEIIYKKGSEMPSNVLSQNMVVDSITFDEDQIQDEQMLDPRLRP